MQRNVYLDGELAHKYGEVLSVTAKSVRDVIRLIEANDPTFKHYVLECADKGIGFSVEVEGDSVEEKDLIFPMKKGDVFISPVPAGSKSGGGKILAAVAIAALFFIPGGPQLGMTAAKAATATSAAVPATMTTLGKVMSSLAINLALTGIQQLMAPDPSTDQGPESYLYNADNQNIVEGDPVPLAYGKVRIPGRAISFSVMNESTYTSTAYSYALVQNQHSGGGDSGSVTENTNQTQNGESTLGGILAPDSDGTIKTIPTPSVTEE